MSRTATDGTRFTQTSPHAYSNPIPNRSSPSNSSTPRSRPQPQRPRNRNNNAPPAGPIETPAQKVARLRAARMAAREAELTRWDRIVLRGRVWADRAHKITALSLIAFTVIAGGVTTFALTDMILHNRRKRAAFYAEQHSLYAARLISAIETEKAGLALDEDQVLVLNRERAKIQAEELKKLGSLWNGVKSVFVGGLKKEEGLGEQILPGVAEGKVPTEGEVLEAIGIKNAEVMERMQGRLEVVEERKVVGDGMEGKMEVHEGGIMKAVEEKRREGERQLEERRVEGGPLDQMGEQAAAAVKSKADWVSRK